MRSYGRDRGLFRICEWPEETAPARRRSSRGGRACQKFDRMGRFSITKTERPRSANLLQMPRGLMCKLRQRGRDYGGPAGSRGIDPSLQPRSRRSNCLDSPLWRLWTGGIIPATQPRIQAKPQFRLRLSGFRHWCRAVRWPVSMKSGVFRSSRCRLLGTKRTRACRLTMSALESRADPRAPHTSPAQRGLVPFCCVRCKGTFAPGPRKFPIS